MLLHPPLLAVELNPLGLGLHAAIGGGADRAVAEGAHGVVAGGLLPQDQHPPAALHGGTARARCEL